MLVWKNICVEKSEISLAGTTELAWIRRYYLMYRTLGGLFTNSSHKSLPTWIELPKFNSGHGPASPMMYL